MTYLQRLTASLIIVLAAWCVSPLGVRAEAVPPSRPAVSSEQAIEQHLTLGKALLQTGKFPEAQAEFRAVLAIDATHRDALILMTKAQQQLEAQRKQLETQQKQAAKERAQLRELAVDVALRVAHEKAGERTRQDARAQEQVARARDQQIHLLYNKGVAYYRAGQFQAAIDTLQQLVPIDPSHALVGQAQRLITRAETQLMQARALAAARQGPQQGHALISDLEQQLTAKRIEVEAMLKYARIAAHEQNHELAIGLLQRVLTQDPRHHDAQQLLEQEQLAQLKDQEDRFKHQVARDEQVMLNDVVKAQLLPESKQVALPIPAASHAMAEQMSAKLREPISLDFTDVPLSDVIAFIADSANLSIIPSPQLDLKTRTVSLKINQLPLEQALKYLAKNQSLAYRINNDAILIATPEEFTNEPLQTRVFFLQNGLGPFALETAAVQSNPTMTADPIKTLIEKSIPQPSGSKLVIDERSGALIVTNTNDNLSLTEHLLSQLDITPVQILIEARFIEVSLAELDQLGLESVLTGNYALSKNQHGGDPGPGNIIAKGGGFKFPTLAREDQGGNFTLEGVLTGLQFETVLHALEEHSNTKTLSAPRVTTLNNQTAMIRVVEEFNYPTRYEVSLVQFDINGDGDFDDAGETQYVNVPKDLQKRDVGILLNVTPSIGKDMKTITLVLSPEVSQAGAFRDLGGGVTVPDFTSSQLTTSVIIQNGETVVLGGLMKDTKSEQTTKVPFFGDLPVVGSLFRQTQQTDTKSNLLIFVTARVLAPRGQTI